MKRTLWVAFALCICCALAALPALAQAPNPHAGPMGQGAPAVVPAEARIDAELAAGEVVVRVIGGGPEEPIAGVDVTLRGPAGTAVARTDGSGTARFAKVAVGDGYSVSATVGETNLGSHPFALPKEGGVRIVLSPKPAASSPAATGRPDPRNMSGVARPERNDPGGQLTVRPVQGPLEQTEFGGLEADVPVGAKVHLVGMAADGTVTIDSQQVKQDDAGRIRFQGLDRGNRVAYYVLGLFPRAGGVDRLTSVPVQLMPEVGSRLMLAGLDPSSAAPPVDDFARHFGGEGMAPEAGEVAVRLIGAPSEQERLQNIETVELVPIAGGGEVISARPSGREPGPDEVVGQSVQVGALSGTAPGQVSFLVVRPSMDAPLSDIEIRLRRVDTGEVVATRRTSVEGSATFGELEAGVQYAGVAVVRGKEIETPTFTATSDEALSFAVAAEWPRANLLEARFSGVPGGADRVYYARVRSDEGDLLSPPFQLTDRMGITVPVYVYPDIFFRLHGGTQLDDERLWFQVQMSLANGASHPFDAGGKGLIIPLPKGFVGASVSDDMLAKRVKVEPDVGFLWRGAFPVGQRDFIVQFALPVVDGKVTFDMPLPHGMTGGRLVLEDMPGMKLDLPSDALARPMERGDKRFIELPNISIDAGKRLVFSISGLPEHPEWKQKLRWAVGGVVLVLIAWGVWGIFAARRESGEAAVRRALERERERLLDQLAELEAEHRADRLATKSYESRRAKLMSRLEEIYRELDGASRAA